MPVPGHQGNHRKTFAVKHQDGEPLTRSDLQYDLLYYIFNDKRAVFTDPYRTIHGEPPGSKVPFRDLYVNALVHSPRCSKVSRDKLLDAPQFADEFAKISLLSNIGRINTTMAFFPEMRTALRTYHPVPSLQKTEGNLQDAPRIKNILKSCLLSTEIQNTPAIPAEVLNRSRSGIVPSTSIVNLVFIFASHAALLAQNHFPSQTNYDVLDFFSPIPISSETRARAFLWLCYHYYEAPSENPYDDDYSRRHPGIIPTLESLSAEEARLENLDTPEEKEWGEKMTAQRKLFMEAKDKMPPPGEHSNGSQEPDSSTFASKQKGSGIGRGTSQGRGRGRGGRRPKGREANLAEAARLSRQNSLSAGDDISLQSATPDHSIGQDTNEGSFALLSQAKWHSRRHVGRSRPPSISPGPSHGFPAVRPLTSPLPFETFPEPLIHQDRQQHLPQPLPTSIEPYPRRRPSGEHLHSDSSNGRPVRTKRRGSARSDVLPHPSIPSIRQSDSLADCTPPGQLPPRSLPLLSPSPYTESQSRSGFFSQHRRLPSVLSLNTPSTFSFPRPRTMLEQAWHVATTTDPLGDSDDEADENTRLDLLLRLKIINRLRGKEPTPEPEPEPVPPPAPAPTASTSHRRARGSHR